MAFGTASGSNTYVPIYEATQPTIDLGRDPKKFRVNQYTRIIPVGKDQGYYLALDPDEQARVVSDAEYLWEDGSDAKQGVDAVDHEFRPYRTVRLSVPCKPLGYKAVKQAAWQVIAAHARMALAKAMLLRTIKACELIFTGANWGANTGTAAAIAGTGAGAWGASTTANAFILKSLMAAAEKIDYNSSGVVSDVDSLILLISPNVAKGIRTSPEFHDYLKGSPEALASLTGQFASRNPNFKYGLPEYLYGFKVVVENCVRIKSRKGDTLVKERVIPDNAAAILSRPDGVVAETDAPTDFSTVAFRFFEEATVESKDDPDNRRYLNRVVEDYTATLQAAQTGFLITGITV